VSSGRVARPRRPTASRSPGRRISQRQAELAALADIGRSILQAQMDQDELCELIYRLAGRIVPTETFQLGLFEGDQYRIKVWIKDGVPQPPTSYRVPEGQGIIGWLRSARQPLLVRDFEVEMESLPARPTYLSDNPPRSGIYLPLLVADTVIGAISIQSQQPDAFDEGHVRLLSILANQSASALNNALLYQRAERRLNALTAVSEVGRRVTNILELDPLLTQLVELIRSRFGYYHAQIFLIEPGSDRAVFKASSGQGLNEKWQAEKRTYRVGQEGIVGWVAEHGEPLIANDVSAEPRYIPDDPRLLPDTRAEMAVPMMVEGQVVGVLDVQSAERDAFGPDDLFTLQTLADQAAVAVNSARAYEAQRVEAWTTTVMLQVAEATSQAESMGEVLDTAVRVTAMLAGVESTILWLWSEEYGAFEYGGAFGLKSDDEEQLEHALRFLEGDWPALDMLRLSRRAAIVRPGMGGDALPAEFHHYCSSDLVALLPMINKGEVFGVLGAGFDRERVPELDERRLAMLGGIAHQIAAAVDNARLTAMREEEAWTSTVLLQVAEAIRRLQPVDVTLEQVTRIAPALTGVDRCVALLNDENGNFRARTVHAQRPGLAEAYQGAVIRPGELPLLDDACRTGQPLVVADTEDNPRIPKAWLERFGSRTILVVPLLVADEPIGALLADDVDTAHIFSARRIRILLGIANQAAIAIENARLQAQEADRARLTRELELAHEIQKTLLPQQAPRLEGYQIAYRWRSAREVGGDFFDFLRLGPFRQGILIADVSDKGIPAALYMMFARTVIRAVAFSGREPATALQRINELILSDSTSDMFVTVHYGLLDLTAHRLTFSSAGHNLALHVPASGSPVSELTTNGLALGIVSDAQFEQKAVDLLPGDIVLFYTDGAIDTLNSQGESFGEQRLTECLCAHRAEPAEAIAEAIDETVRVWAGTEAQYDDFTLIVIKRSLVSGEAES
jgi:phosphoserine phosphatase RsbU/P